MSGFAPWTNQELFDYAYARRMRIAAKRPRYIRTATHRAHEQERERAKKAAR